MSKIQIDLISGVTYPVDLYVSDVYGNNKTFVSTITSGPIPPAIDFTSLPAIFNTAPAVMITMVDANLCEKFEIAVCESVPNLTPTPTPTLTPTPITPTPTPTLTPTPITPTPTPTITLTPSITPTPPSALKALIFMESGDDTLYNEFAPINTNLTMYMLSNGCDWLGFHVSDMPDLTDPNQLDDFLIWMDWPGFVTGTTNVPPVIKVPVPQTSGGLDSYNNPIEAYKFVTTEVTGGTTTGNVQYVVLAPLSLTNNQLYYSVGINYNNSSAILTDTLTDLTRASVNIVYTGTNWANTTYRTYTQSPSNGFDNGYPGVTDMTNNYFRGGTLI